MPFVHRRDEVIGTHRQAICIQQTNSLAESDSRSEVIDRKLSFETQSEAVRRFFKQLLTISESCRLQKCPVYQRLRDTVEASLNRKFAPQCLGAP